MTRGALLYHLSSELLREGGCAGQHVGCLMGTDRRVEQRLVKVHNQTPAPSAEQVLLSLPPPIIEHAHSKMYRADQAEQTAVPMSLILWTGPGEGTPTAIFLLRLVQEQIGCDS